MRWVLLTWVICLASAVCAGELLPKDDFEGAPGTTGRLDLPHASEAWDLMGAPMPIPPDKTLAVSDAPVYVLLKEYWR